MKRLLVFCREHFIVVSIASYSLGFAQHFLVILKHGEIMAADWKPTQYHINYFEYGFAKRALVGTLFFPVMSLLPDGGTEEKLFVVSVSFVTFIALVLILRAAINSLPPDWRGIRDVLPAILCFAPVGFMQISYDIGRYDLFNYLVIATMFVLIRRGALLSAAAVLTVGILIHEAVFFIALPLLLIAVVHDGFHVYRVIKCTFMPVSAMALTALFGNLSEQELALLPPEVSGGAGVWTRGVLEPAGYLGVANYMILGFYALVPLALLVKLCRENELSTLKFVSPLSIVGALFFLGTDYFRWVHLLFVSVLSVVFFIATTERSTNIAVDRRDRLTLLAFSFPLGPIGISQGLPYIRRLLESFQ
jgi:hypothetical protein